MSSFDKASTTPAGRDRLRHEAAMLAQARHPGVVPLLRLDEQPDRTTLVLGRPAERTLADAPPTDPMTAVRMLAALAATVADLHRLGMAHRRLQPDHVLLAGDRPMLCGFAEATAAADDTDRAADDRDLRNLVDLFVAHAGTSGGAGRMLRSLAVSDPAGRPLRAHQLAQRAGKPAARRTRPAGSAVPRPGRRRVAAVLAGPVVVVAALGWSARPAGHEAGAPPARSDAAPDTSGTLPGSASRPDDRPSGPTIGTGTTTVPVAGAGGRPPDPGDTAAGATPVRIHAGGAIYEVGQEGDQVVVADWRCTGEPAAVLLRPGTGELFVFDVLPDTAAPVVGRRLATVTGAREILTGRVTQACPPLVVRDAAGTAHQVGAP